MGGILDVWRKESDIPKTVLLRKAIEGQQSKQLSESDERGGLVGLLLTSWCGEVAEPAS